MTPPPKGPNDSIHQPTSAGTQSSRRFWTLLVLVLVITGAALALGHYGVTPLTILGAVTAVVAALFSGWRARSDREPVTPVALGPARRALLTSAALSTAAVVGETARRRDSPQPDANGNADAHAHAHADVVSLTDYGDLAIDRRDGADPSTWDWTPALREAVRVAATKARVSRQLESGSAYRRTGLPPIRIPGGSYRITGSVALEYLHDLTIAGEGRERSLLVYEGDDALFHVHRSSTLTFKELTITGSDPAAAESDLVKGLREGSCAFRFIESSSDENQGGGNTYQCTFTNMEINEMGCAFAFLGDQMTDGMIWNDVRFRDNFIDLDYANGQSVNHQFFGGEVHYGVTYDEAAYTKRLGTWTSPPDLRDGALLNISTGGDVSFFGGSIIVRKPTLTFAPPEQAESTDVMSNTLGYNFFATRWEFRERDPAGDQSGLQRCTLVRWLAPAPDDRRVQPTLRFDACRFGMIASDIDLLYIANATAISWDGCRVFPPTSARVVSLTSPATALNPGAFLAVGSTVLPLVHRALAATSDNVEHVIDVTARGAPDISREVSKAGYSSVVAGLPSTARRVIYFEPGGLLLKEEQSTLQVRLHVPPGALVKQVGAVLSVGTVDSVSISFNNDLQTLATLNPGPATLMQVQQVEQFVATGLLDVTASRPGTAALSGYVYVEFF